MCTTSFAPSGLTPVAPPPTPKPPPSPTPPVDPKMASFHADAIRRGQDHRLRALACALQWILAPSQQAAEQARAAATATTDNDPSKHLAKAAFWCGDSLGKDPKVPIPPPPNLPRKGILVAVNKAMTGKGSSWSSKDRLHHFTNLAVDVVSGRSTWQEDTLVEFEEVRAVLEARNH